VGLLVFQEVINYMGETNEAVKDAKQTSNSATPSTPQTGSTSQETPKTFTESDMQKAVSDALAKAGRDAKALTEQRALLDKEKTEHSAWQTEREKAQREKEDAALDEATKDAPEQKATLKQYREKLREERRKLDEDRVAFEQERTAHSGDIETAKQTRFEIDVFDAAKAAGVDAQSLKDAATDLSITGQPAIEKLAARMPKKATAQEHVDSGKTVWGEDLSKLSAAEKYQRGRDKEIKK
jgi:hypothetical protein